MQKHKSNNLILEIDRYGFFEADTDISAIHGPIYRPILIFPKFFNLVFCFIIKNVMYRVTQKDVYP